MYMTVWVVGIIITFVFAGTKYFQDYFNGAIFGIGFFFSIALAAVLGIVPALILHNSKKKIISISAYWGSFLSTFWQLPQ